MIDIEELSFSYQNNDKVLNNISIRFYNGVCGLCGPNGSGKTTLIKIIAGILKNYSGIIRIFNKDIKDIPDLSKYVSYVPGEVSTPFELSVLDVLLIARIGHLGFFKSYSKKDIDIVCEVASEVGIENILKRKFNTLSNGEKQIVLISQALSQKTSIILMDEPTSHLDIKHRIKIFEIIKNISKNVLVISVLQDLNLAFDYCDKIVFLKNGEKSYELESKNSLDIKRISEIYDVDEKLISKFFQSWTGIGL